MEKKERYHQLAKYLCAAYTAYRANIGLNYALKAYVQNQKTLGTFWFHAAEMIDQSVTDKQAKIWERDPDPDKLLDLLKEHYEPYDLKPLSSMTDDDIEKLVDKLPEGCDVCGNPPPEIVIWLLRELRNLLPATFTPQPKGSIQ